MEPASPTGELIAAQLGRILQSSTFRGAERSSALLLFLVEQTLNGRADHLKEYTLGAEALGRGEGFDPRTDPIVRAEASRLRARLERYYGTEGQADAIAIVLPKGTYVPQFETRVPPVASGSPTPAPGQTVQRERRLFVWVVVGVAVCLAAMALWLSARTTRSAERPLMQVEVELRSRGELGSDVGTDVILSNDGRRIAFVSRSADGVARLNALRLDRPPAIELPGTDGARGPFFSPDGQWVGFWASGKLKKIALDGGTPIDICDAVNFLGASWGEDGHIVGALSSGQLWRVSSSSGEPVLLADMTSDLIDPRWPQILPGGTHVLFTAVRAGGPDRADIEVLSLADSKRKTLARAGTYGRYLPGGYLTYINQGTLYAMPFDLDRLEAAPGTPLPVLDDVQYSSEFGFGQLDVSSSGTLIYRRTAARGHAIAAWMDASGATQPLPLEPCQYTFPRLSPDGRRVAFVRTESGTRTVWIHDLDSERTRRVSATPGDYSPVWSPDGRVLVVGGGSGLYWLHADGSGTPQPLTAGAAVQIPWSFSPDGTRLAYHELSKSTGFDLWTVQVHAAEEGVAGGQPEVFLKTPTYTTYPSFSPDGRWLAYGSGAYGKWEVYVRPFPDDGMEEVQVSRGGGRISKWLPGGRELLYRTDDHRLMVASYRVEDGAFIAEKPRQWSPGRLADTGVLSNFDLEPGGSRVLALMPAVEPEDHQSPNHVTIAFNFADDVRRRFGTRDR